MKPFGFLFKISFKVYTLKMVGGGVMYKIYIVNWFEKLIHRMSIQSDLG